MKETEDNKKPVRMGRPKGQTKQKLTEPQLLQLKKDGVRKLLNEHYSRKQFYAWLKEEYGLSTSRGKELWNVCWAEVEQKYELDINQMVIKHAHHYWEIFQLSKEHGDWTNARNTLNDIGKLFNLFDSKKVEINKGDEITFKFGDE